MLLKVSEAEIKPNLFYAHMRCRKPGLYFYLMPRISFFRYENGYALTWLVKQIGLEVKRPINLK